MNQDIATCGTCGRSWDDGIPTSWTPAPSGRCPFEYFHDEGEVPEDFPVQPIESWEMEPWEVADQLVREHPCDDCGEDLANDAGEGYDGLCGECADRAEDEGRWD